MPDFVGTALASAFIELGGDLSRLGQDFSRAKSMTSSATSQLSKQAKVKMSLDMQAFTSSLKQARTELAANLKGLNTQIRSAQQKIEQNYGAILSSARQVGIGMVAAGGAITASLGLAVKTAAGFQQSMANVQSVANASGKELQKLSDYARLMGKQSVFSASQAADAMYFLASAGMDTTQIMGALQGTLNLAAATQSDLASTTATVASTLAAFGLEAKQADRISNVFAATISASQATMDKLATSMQYVAPVAKSVGLSLEETSAILGQLYNAGIDASTAGTALRQGIAQLLDPTQEVIETFAKLGVSLYDVNGNVRPFLHLVRDLEKASLQAADAMAIFGVRAGPAMLTLIQQGTDSLDKLVGKITNTNRATEMAALQTKTFQGAMKLFRSAVEEAQISIGTRLLPVLTDGVKRITDIVNAVSSWTEAHPRLTSAIGKLALALGPMIAAGGVLALAAPTILNIGMAAKMAAPLVTRFGQALLLARFGTAASALTGLTTAFAGIAAGVALYAAATKMYAEARKNVFDERGIQADINNIKGYIKAVDKLEMDIANLQGNLTKYRKASAEGLDYSESIDITNRKLEQMKARLRETITEMIGYADSSGNLNKALTDLGAKYSDVQTIIDQARQRTQGQTQETDGAAKATRALSQETRNLEQALTNVGISLRNSEGELRDYGMIVKDLEQKLKEFPSVSFFPQVPGLPTIEEKLAEMRMFRERTEAERKKALSAWMKPLFYPYSIQELTQQAIGDIGVVEVEPEVKIRGKVDTRETERAINETIEFLKKGMGFDADTAGWFQGLSDKEREYWQGRVTLAEKNAEKLKDIERDYAAWYERKHTDLLSSLTGAEMKYYRSVTGFDRPFVEMSLDQLRDVEKAWQSAAENISGGLRSALAQASVSTMNWRNVFMDARRDVQQAMKGLFASMIDWSQKPAWAQFWDDMKSIAINALAEIAVKMASLKFTEAALGAMPLGPALATADLAKAGVAGIGGVAKAVGGGIAGVAALGGGLGAVGLAAAGAFGLYKLFDSLLDREDKADRIRGKMAASLDEIANQANESRKEISSLNATVYASSKDSTRSIVDAIFGKQRQQRQGVPRNPGIGGEGASVEEELSRLARLQSGSRRYISEYQFGGIVTRPQVAMVGEAGPEAIIPLRQGAVPVQMQQQAIQSQVIQPNVTMEKGAIQITEEYPNVRLDTMTMDQRMRMYEKTLKPAIEEWGRRGMFLNARR